MLAVLPDPTSADEARARILAIRSRQKVASADHAQRLAEQKAESDAAARVALTAAAERAVRLMEAQARRRAERIAAKPEADLTRDPRKIIARVAREYGVRVRDIDGPSRNKTAVNARFAAIHTIREANPHFSLSRVGQCVGGRDHSSVHNALRKIASNGLPQPSNGPAAGGAR